MRRRAHLLVASASIGLAAAAGSRPLSAPVSAQSGVRTFKIAFYNIQSGKGQEPLPGNPKPFTDTTNCTDQTQPLNAWGVGFVQSELTARIANDPGVVALGLTEAWPCADPQAVRNVLGWPAASTERNGTALLARFGFAGPEEWLQLDTSLNMNPSDSMWIMRRPICLDAACAATMTIYTAHWFFWTTLVADSYTSAETQARQSIDFMARLPAGQPHILIGDLNAFEGTARLC